MEAFTYRNGELFAEDVRVTELAERYGTPLFVYSRNHMLAQYKALDSAMSASDPLICYSVKVNSNGAVIRTFAEAGAGADVVSGGELFRARRAGIDASKIAFAGVGKTVADIEYALEEGILFFTVESEQELQRISECASRMGKVGRVAMRVNPDVDPQTHRYISTGKKENKFGLDLERAAAAYKTAGALPGIEVVGLHMHIGSQILTAAPFAEAVEKVTALCLDLKKEFSTFRYLDIGGGIGIQYKEDQQPLDPAKFAEALNIFLRQLGLQVVMEPGRFLTGNAGVLVSRVQYVKQSAMKQFVITDAGMNDLIRPPLYQAHHDVVSVKKTSETIVGDVVGPICESADFVAADRRLPKVEAGDLLAVRSAGAYGFSMASNYNSRCRAAEVMVSHNRHELVRERETRDDLVRGERFPEW